MLLIESISDLIFNIELKFHFNKTVSYDDIIDKVCYACLATNLY